MKFFSSTIILRNLTSERKKINKECEEMDISPEEYAKYKRDVLKDLQKQKQKCSYNEMNDMILNGIESKPSVSISKSNN